MLALDQRGRIDNFPPEYIKGITCIFFVVSFIMSGSMQNVKPLNPTYVGVLTKSHIKFCQYYVQNLCFFVFFREMGALKAYIDI